MKKTKAQIRQDRIKRRRIILAAVIVIIIGWLLVNNNKTQPKTDVKNNKPAVIDKDDDKPKKDTKTIRLIATGDMLPHDTVNQAARTSNGYDYLPIFSSVANYMKDADLAYCNQESPSASQFAVSGYPTFNAPPSFAEDLSKLGCNVINLANNHANDRGQSGIAATRAVWDKLPTVAVAGTARNQSEQNAISTFTKDGVKFAFLSYAKCSNSRLAKSYGLNILSKSLIDKQVADAKQQGADIIIAAAHWCRESISSPDGTETMWTQYLADKGVDIVIGTGPHWLQPVRQLPKAGGGTTLVWYSLGNFLSTQLEVNGLIGGIAVMNIDVTTKSVASIGFLPVYMHYEWTAAEAKREDLLARHNLKLYPLDQATAPLARSQNHTTVQAQTERVTKLMNTYTNVTMLTSTTYSSFGR